MERLYNDIDQVCTLARGNTWWDRDMDELHFLSFLVHSAKDLHLYSQQSVISDVKTQGLTSDHEDDAGYGDPRIIRRRVGGQH